MHACACLCVCFGGCLLVHFSFPFFFCFPLVTCVFCLAKFTMMPRRLQFLKSNKKKSQLVCVRVCFVSTSCADLKQIAAQQQQQARASSKLTYFARLQLVWFARRVQTASKLESASESVFSLSLSRSEGVYVCADC